MDSYIVRLYRRDNENPENLVGLVETVGAEEKRSFHTVKELMAILSEPHPHEMKINKPVFKVIQAGRKNPG